MKNLIYTIVIISLCSCITVDKRCPDTSVLPSVSFDSKHSLIFNSPVIYVPEGAEVTTAYILEEDNIQDFMNGKTVAIYYLDEFDKDNLETISSSEDSKLYRFRSGHYPRRFLIEFIAEYPKISLDPDAIDDKLYLTGYYSARLLPYVGLPKVLKSEEEPKIRLGDRIKTFTAGCNFGDCKLKCVK